MSCKDILAIKNFSIFFYCFLYFLLNLFSSKKKGSNLSLWYVVSGKKCTYIIITPPPPTPSPTVIAGSVAVQEHNFEMGTCKENVCNAQDWWPFSWPSRTPPPGYPSNKPANQRQVYKGLKPITERDRACPQVWKTIFRKLSIQRWLHCYCTITNQREVFRTTANPWRLP